MDCTTCVAKTKALISFFVFTSAKSRFSHNAAHIIFWFVVAIFNLMRSGYTWPIC